MRKMKYSGIPTVGNIPDRWSIPKIKHHAVFFNGDRSARYPKETDFVKYPDSTQPMRFERVDAEDDRNVPKPLETTS